MKSFIVYAHRGASEYCPENTLLSFYTGVYMGANGIETDVQRTKDGTLVLFHDANIKRMTGVDCEVASIDYKELHSLPLPPTEEPTTSSPSRNSSRDSGNST